MHNQTGNNQKYFAWKERFLGELENLTNKGHGMRHLGNLTSCTHLLLSCLEQNHPELLSKINLMREDLNDMVLFFASQLSCCNGLELSGAKEQAVQTSMQTIKDLDIFKNFIQAIQETEVVPYALNNIDPIEESDIIENIISRQLGTLVRNSFDFDLPLGSEFSAKVIFESEKLRNALENIEARADINEAAIERVRNMYRNQYRVELHLGSASSEDIANANCCVSSCDFLKGRQYSLNRLKATFQEAGVTNFQEQLVQDSFHGDYKKLIMPLPDVLRVLKINVSQEHKLSASQPTAPTSITPSHTHQQSNYNTSAQSDLLPVAPMPIDQSTFISLRDKLDKMIAEINATANTPFDQETGKLNPNFVPPEGYYETERILQLLLDDMLVMLYEMYAAMDATANTPFDQETEESNPNFVLCKCYDQTRKISRMLQGTLDKMDAAMDAAGNTPFDPETGELNPNFAPTKGYYETERILQWLLDMLVMLDEMHAAMDVTGNTPFDQETEKSNPNFELPKCYDEIRKIHRVLQGTLDEMRPAMDATGNTPFDPETGELNPNFVPPKGYHEIEQILPLLRVMLDEMRPAMDVTGNTPFDQEAGARNPNFKSPEGYTGIIPGSSATQPTKATCTTTTPSDKTSAALFQPYSPFAPQLTQTSTPATTASGSQHQQTQSSASLAAWATQFGNGQSAKPSETSDSEDMMQALSMGCKKS